MMIYFVIDPLAHTVFVCDFLESMTCAGSVLKDSEYKVPLAAWGTPFLTAVDASRLQSV